jgi:hypothetical protein
MKARILKKVKRRAALCAAASLLAACSSTQEAASEESSYRSPYQSYRSLCVVPAEAHSASLDLTLARMLRDRGFEPELLETGDLPSVRRCRGIVTFSTGRTLRPFEAPASMSLTFLDAYTGETYHVAASRAKGGEGHALFADAPFSDPAQMIRQLVERLFPERTDRE